MSAPESTMFGNRVSEHDYASRDEISDFSDLAELYLDDMRDGERKFVMDFNERIEQYGDKTFISPRQRAWLKDLVQKYLVA